MKALAFLGTFTTGFWVLGLVFPATAQVTSDGTTNTIINPNGNNFNILNGVEKGNNLFHSFSNFSVPAGGAANFDLTNTPNITTIFSRVTGGNVSNIDGLIRTLNSSNPVSLFLINPAGVVFGKDASLNIGGSFVGTTANSIKFADGMEFSAVNPNSTPLLTMSTPIGLQFGSQPNPIINRSVAGLQVQPGRTIGLLGGNLTLEATSLTSPSGRVELGSVGSNSLVALNTSQPQMTFDYSGVSSFQDMQMTQGVLADVSGTGGTLQVQGRSIQLTDGSQIRNHTVTGGSAGQVLVRASEKLTIVGTVPTGQLTSRISTELLGGTTNAQGTHITVEAPTLELTQGAVVRSGMDNATGTAGNITVKANSILLGTGNTSEPHSLISTTLNNESAGAAGNINIDTQTLKLLNGSRIATGADNKSQVTGGNISINATNIDIEGVSLANQDRVSISAITSELNRGSSGQGGNIQIATQQLHLDGGGNVTSAIFSASSGKAGNVSVKANDIQISRGYAPEWFASGIYSTVRLSPKRGTEVNESGNILIEANRLQLIDGAIISTGVFRSEAKPGSLTIRAHTVEARGVSDFVQESGFFANSLANPWDGKSGALTIEADTLRLSDGAKIVVGGIGYVLRKDEFDSLADSGDVFIRARNVEITGSKGVVLADYPFLGTFYNRSGINATSGRGSKGNGGSVRIETDRLSILDGAEIVALTADSGNAGNIVINARDSITIDGNYAIDTSRAAPNYPNPRADDRFRSRISTGSEGKATGSSGVLTLNTPNLFITNGGEISSSNLGIGNAGNVNINTSNRLSLNASAISVNGSAQGNAGNLQIRSGEIYLSEGAKLQAEVLQGNQGNINIDANSILMRYGSEISTNATGNANGGNIQINAPVIVGLENSNIIANAAQGRGGNIDITTQGIIGLEFRNTLTPRVDQTNDITASSAFNVNGTVEINNIGVDPSTGLIELPVNLTDPSQQIATGCTNTRNSGFIATGRGGIQQNPNQQMASERAWSDVRDLTAYRKTEQTPAQITESRAPLVQATGWQRNTQGKVELIATQPVHIQPSLTCNAVSTDK